MNQSIVINIEKQLTNCKQLLVVFRSEREMYQGKESVTLKDVMIVLKRKQEIMEAFEEQQNILRKFKEGYPELTEEDKTKQKKLLRDLASTLEQLLVIDQENEKLLREMLSVAGKNCPNISRRIPGTPKRIRPALKPNLPFVPDTNLNINVTRKNRMSDMPVKNDNSSVNNNNADTNSAKSDNTENKPRNITLPSVSPLSGKNLRNTNIFPRKPLPQKNKLKNYILPAYS